MTRTSLETAQDCQDFVNGCLFMGTGGGGSPVEGMALLQSGLHDGLDMGWAEVESIDDGDLTITAYASGSIAPPSPETQTLIESLHLGEPGKLGDALVEAIEELGQHLGKAVAAVVPVELGASNSPGPIVAAARMGLEVPDGDYSGRAVPDEMQGTPFINGISSAPFTTVDQWGNVAIVPRVANAYMLERVSKMLSIAGIHGTAVASTPLSGAEMKRIIVPGTLTKALNIGRATRLARDSGDDPIAAAVDASNGWRLFDGHVVDKEWQDRDGYMFGSVRIEATDPANGSELRVWFKNENHVTWLDGEPWVCSPDLVTIANRETGLGYTSTDIAIGDSVSVVGVRGLDVFRSDEALQNAFGPAYFGFPEITYKPIESLV